MDIGGSAPPLAAEAPATPLPPTRNNGQTPTQQGLTAGPGQLSSTPPRVVLATDRGSAVGHHKCHPLATFWPMEAIKPSLQAPPSHRTTVLTPRMACCLAAGSRGRQHRQRPRHVHRGRWRKWVNVHPFLHRWSTKQPPPPPTVCTPLGYVYPRRVMPLPKP